MKANPQFSEGFPQHPTPRMMPPGVSAPPSLPPGFVDETSTGQGTSLWTMIDDRMRGRWKWATIIGLALATVLGVVAFVATKPMYRSVGAIRVVPEVPVILHTTEFHSQRDPERFRASQVQYIRSSRVLERALMDEEVAKLDWAKQPNVMRELKNNLNAERDRESELIFVQFEAEDPVVAQSVTNAVLRSYYEEYGRFNGQDVPGTLAELKDNEARVQRMVHSIEQAKRALDTKYLGSDLTALQVANMQRLGELETKIRDGKRQLERIAKSQPAAPVEGEVLPDAGLLEQQHPMLTLRRGERDRAQMEFDDIKSRHQPGRPLYDNARNKLDNAITLYQEEYQRAVAKWKAAGSPAAPGTLIALNAEDIQIWEQEYADLTERQRLLVNDVRRLKELQYDEEAAHKELAQIRDRVKSIETEAKQLGGFISIANYGSKETEPYENSRRKRAVMAVALGLMASFGGFFLLGSIDRRAYGASQLNSATGANAPVCLGVLPDLGASLADPEASDMAAHCVHQIRNQIEARRDPRRGYVLAVSSPFQGDGKTSIVMALGWSYAAAGYETLVIDCDLVGRSLTRQLGLTGREGLRDALAMRDLNGSVSRMPVENLSAVPAGVDISIGPESIRRIDIENILDQVRDKFDIILIDTGPMLGSLESTPVTASADGVLLSVRRGRSRTRLEECVSRLSVTGVPCVGVVLNCAYRSDCHRYVSEASLAAAEEERAGGAAKVNGSAPEKPRQSTAPNALVRAIQTSNRMQSQER